MIELERTYLAKFMPDGLNNGEELIDIYVPKSEIHPVLRIRKKGNKFEITKKTPIKDDDGSRQKEETIILTEKEFKELSEIEGKRLSKIRYLYNYDGKNAEVDVFQDISLTIFLVQIHYLY